MSRGCRSAPQNIPQQFNLKQIDSIITSSSLYTSHAVEILFIYLNLLNFENATERHEHSAFQLYNKSMNSLFTGFHKGPMSIGLKFKEHSLTQAQLWTSNSLE